MAGYHGHVAGTMYTCVDKNPDTLHGGQTNKNGYLFYAVEARCGSLKCPPYVEGRELTCVVCSKERVINIPYAVFTYASCLIKMQNGYVYSNKGNVTRFR